MKKHIKNSALLLCIVSGLIIIINKLISVFSHMTDYQPSGGKYYHWKYGNNNYTKSGKGKPVFLIHELDPTASSYEWKAVTKKLAENHKFADLAELWIHTDPYKHRVMRIAGIDEEMITGIGISGKERYDTWASIFTRTLGNPLFH